MSFGLTMAGVSSFLAPMVVPALTGAGVGLASGALSGDGFSDDDWWQNMLLGLGTGAAAGAFSGAGPMSGKIEGLLGGKSMTGSQLGANLGTGPAHISSYANNPAAAKFIDPSMVTESGMDYTGMWNNVNSAGEYIGTNPDLIGQGGGMFGSMMPSKDTMVKGLLGSQILKGMTKQDRKPAAQQARISPISKAGAPMKLSRRGGQPGGAFMGGGPRGPLGSRRY